MLFISESSAQYEDFSAHSFLPANSSMLFRSEDGAFKNSVESITGPISKTISTQGMLAVYEKQMMLARRSSERPMQHHSDPRWTSAMKSMKM